jgi:lambda family phage portal protein
MFFELAPGESIETIQSNRPSAMVLPFRDAQMKAVASGTKGTASSISGNYDGSYSAQRQEMVEGYAGYESLQNTFIAKWTRPHFRHAIDIGIATGRLVPPADLDLSTLSNAVYICPVMPWIDPDKESKSNERRIKMGTLTEASVIRSSGGNPAEVKRQRIQEIKENKANDLIFSSDARHEVQQQVVEQPEPPEPEA